MPQGLFVFLNTWRRAFFQGFTLHFDVDLHVKTGRSDIGVSQPVFDNGDVDIGLDHMQCRRVPKGVWRNILLG